MAARASGSVVVASCVPCDKTVLIILRPAASIIQPVVFVMWPELLCGLSGTGHAA
jgi:hypothetical protein